MKKKKYQPYAQVEAAQERERRKQRVIKLIKAEGNKGIRRQHISQELQGVLNQLIQEGVLLKFEKKGRGDSRYVTPTKYKQVWLRYNPALRPPKAIKPGPVLTFPLNEEEKKRMHWLESNKVERAFYMQELLTNRFVACLEGDLMRWNSNDNCIEIYERPHLQLSAADHA